MKTIAERLDAVTERICTAAAAAGRSADEIVLVAVSKTQPAESVAEASRAGLVHFGENRVQEAVSKAQTLAHLPVHWHMVGHLQKNKVRPAARCFDVIHSLDSIGLARTLNTELARENRRMDAFLQIKLTREETRTGIVPEELDQIADAIRQFDRIQVIGLMTIPPFTEDPALAASYFKKLRELRDRLNRTVFRDNLLHCLSMGMSHDVEIAIREGATHVRIGTAIFGERHVDRK